MALNTWARILLAFLALLWILGLTLIALSTPAIDYPAYEARVDKILSNPADIAACEDAAVIDGKTSCVKDFYVSRAYQNFEWFVLYFTLPVLIFFTFPVILYLIFERGFWFIVMTLFLALAFVWIIIVIIVTTTYWINCSKHSACSNALYTYDFTGVVKQTTADWWIVHMVGHYLVFFSIIFLFIGGIAAQACFSRSIYDTSPVSGAEVLFSKGDQAKLAEYPSRIGSDLQDQDEKVARFIGHFKKV